MNLQKAEFVAGRLIDSYIYGEQHPYGVYTQPSDIDLISAEACRQFYNDYYVNGKCIIFVSGRFTEELKMQLNSAFGQLGANSKIILVPSFQSTPSAERKFRIDNDPNAVQGAIRIAMPFPNRHHPDFKKVLVLNTL